MNLFISFAVNNALWLIWYRFIVANTDVLLNNDVRMKSIIGYHVTYFMEKGKCIKMHEI